MGQERNAILAADEAANRRRRQEAETCFCGQPIASRHPKWGDLCAAHLDQYERDDALGR